MPRDVQASPTGQQSGPGGHLLKEIESQIGSALGEMFTRACKDGVVRDRKDKLNPPRTTEGIVQDCEFGMILLHGRAWLRERNALPESLSHDENVQSFVVKLVEKTATTLFNVREVDKGGESHDLLHFKGAPYTQIGRADAYSANLDSAMLVLGFLAPALKEYHAELENVTATAKFKPAQWIKSLRDAALFICNAGIEYAEKSQVKLHGFAGFSCDPNSTLTDNSVPYLEPEDRLFFTWTATETIHDLVEWLKDFDAIAQGSPPDIIAEIRRGVQKLEGTLNAAANWCKTEFFLGRFRSLQAVDVAAIVTEIELLKGGRLKKEQADRVEAVKHYVQHVYHISQYAAIRSLAPSQLKLDEVRDICDRLHNLVMEDILKSKLDISEQQLLFKTLTRTYKLGLGITDFYEDDAYYPLVVRSISGFLSRTIDQLGKSASRAEITILVAEFKRVLRDHYKNLIERRPHPYDPGDGKLWSFAAAQPYILYATQRTLFALLCYASFLEKMDRFEQQVDSDDVLEASITEALTQRLVKDLLDPAIKEIVKLSKEQAASQVPQLPQTDLLPAQDWAAVSVRRWLEKLVHDFDSLKIADHLLQRADALVVCYQWLLNCALPNDKTRTEENKLHELQSEFQKQMSECGLLNGQTLRPADLLPHLFDDLFTTFVVAHVNSLEKWKEGPNTQAPKARWTVLLKDAVGFRKKIEERGEKSKKGESQ